MMWFYNSHLSYWAQPWILRAEIDTVQVLDMDPPANIVLRICCKLSKGRTNIELREQFILADGVSQTMTAFKSKAGTTGGASTVSSQSGNRSAQSLPAAGPITKVKERSIRSVPMGGRARSTDRTTPDSTFSDDGFSLNRLPRKSSAGPGLFVLF
ncbi:Microtubule-actin cross-linking factor 1 [Orchesella cincta]|uniref:Microtubule-actin cross-linking factor 1 n=1 Tax=Orchesella cincta TaxID=48709 RepID=A0A1D2N8Y2_ORCCI|nr:Microtubule-actin cross-linking factor 1 [Orchesella cincta]